MRWLSWVLYLWPGVPQLLRRASWRNLAVALAWAAAVDGAILATFGWEELLPPSLRNAIWMLLGAAWLALLVFSSNSEQSGRRPTGDREAADNFSLALDYYLKGQWFQAERVLREQLAAHERDLEARLLLATLYRRTRRAVEAAAELDRLERFEGSQKWALEICRERQLLAQGVGQTDSSEADEVTGATEETAAATQAA